MLALGVNGIRMALTKTQVMQKNPIDPLLIKILTNKASQDEHEMFKNWYEKSNENKQYFKKFSIIWEKIGDSYNNLEFNKEKTRNRIHELIQQKQDSKKRQITWWSVAASVILISGLSLFLLHKRNYSINDFYSYTSGNEVMEIVLPDSSLVWLNTNSILKAPNIFRRNNRTVHLKGEAFFQVRQNKKAPFMVIAGETTTKVLGTSFNIYHEIKTGFIEVNVTTGSVAFYKNGKGRNSKVMLPGEIGIFNPSKSKITVTSNNNPNYLSWKTGIIEFNDTPISEVCQVLSKHYGKKIKTSIKDPEVVLTGKFENEKLEDILRVIEITIKAKIKVTEEEILIYK